MGSKSKASASSASKEEKRESKQVRLLEEAKAKLECKVDMLATMVAMKDECLKASDERLLALKWELLANHRGDEEKLHALAQALRERCQAQCLQPRRWAHAHETAQSTDHAPSPQYSEETAKSSIHT